MGGRCPLLSVTGHQWPTAVVLLLFIPNALPVTFSRSEPHLACLLSSIPLSLSDMPPRRASGHAIPCSRNSPSACNRMVPVLQVSRNSWTVWRSLPGHLTPLCQLSPCICICHSLLLLLVCSSDRIIPAWSPGVPQPGRESTNQQEGA